MNLASSSVHSSFSHVDVLSLSPDAHTIVTCGTQTGARHDGAEQCCFRAIGGTNTRSAPASWCTALSLPDWCDWRSRWCFPIASSVCSAKASPLASPIASPLAIALSLLGVTLRRCHQLKRDGGNPRSHRGAVPLPNLWVREFPPSACAGPKPKGFKSTPGFFKRTPGSFKKTPGSFNRTPGYIRS